MQIELRRISYSAALSQETAAFSAEVWIEGELAFHARNQGTGGADFYHQVGRWTVAEVDAWLKAHPACAAICVAHRPGDVPPGFTRECVLGLGGRG